MRRQPKDQLTFAVLLDPQNPFKPITTRSNSKQTRKGWQFYVFWGRLAQDPRMLDAWILPHWLAYFKGSKALLIFNSRSLVAGSVMVTTRYIRGESCRLVVIAARGFGGFEWLRDFGGLIFVVWWCF